MKILITGAPGFVGRHLAADLLRGGHDVCLTGISNETIEIPGFKKNSVLKMDITSPDDCFRVVNSACPDAVVHLAGLAQTVGHTSAAFEAVNITGAGHVAEALKQLSKDNPKLFLFVSSAYVYGGDAPSGTFPCAEATRTSPRGTYGESKLAAEKLVMSLAGNGLDVYVVRPFNHIGPGQELSFVVPGIATKIKNASSGAAIETGNMNSLRDFTDVRDVVRAYRLILEKRPKEKTFVIGSGKPVAIQKIFDFFNESSGKNVNPTVTEHLKRVESTAAIVADITLAKNVLGWAPEIKLEQSLRDVWNELK